jgi:hypothetical protein
VRCWYVLPILPFLVIEIHQQKCIMISLPGGLGKLRPKWWVIRLHGIARDGITNLATNRKGPNR